MTDIADKIEVLPPDLSFDQELKAFNDEMVKEFAAAAEAKEPAPEPLTVKEVVQEVKTEEKSPGIERGLERLVSREVEIRTREEAISKREAEFKLLESKVRDLEAKRPPADLMTALRETPATALQALDIDPDDLVRRIIAEKLGDKAPQELRQTLRETATSRQMRMLEQKVIEQQRAADAREYFTKVDSAARQYVESEISKHAEAPTVVRVAKTQPDRVHREIMQEIIRDAQVRQGQDPNGDPLSYAEAVKRVEVRWSDFSKLLGPDVSESKNAPAETKVQAPSPKPSTPTIKSERPLAPWLVRSEEDGIKAAIHEWRRVEQGKE